MIAYPLLTFISTLVVKSDYFEARLNFEQLNGPLVHLNLGHS